MLESDPLTMLANASATPAAPPRLEMVEGRDVRARLAGIETVGKRSGPGGRRWRLRALDGDCVRRATGSAIAGRSPQDSASAECASDSSAMRVRNRGCHSGPRGKTLAQYAPHRRRHRGRDLHRCHERLDQREGIEGVHGTSATEKIGGLVPIDGPARAGQRAPAPRGVRWSSG